MIVVVVFSGWQRRDSVTVSKSTGSLWGVHSFGLQKLHVGFWTKYQFGVLPLRESQSIRTRIHRQEVTRELPVCHQFVYILVWLWLSLRGSLHSLWGLDFMNFARSDIYTCNIVYRLYRTYIHHSFFLLLFPSIICSPILTQTNQKWP